MRLCLGELHLLQVLVPLLKLIVVVDPPYFPEVPAILHFPLQLSEDFRQADLRLEGLR
jgi:hypothetical protein